MSRRNQHSRAAGRDGIADLLLSEKPLMLMRPMPIQRHALSKVLHPMLRVPIQKSQHRQIEPLTDGCKHHADCRSSEQHTHDAADNAHARRTDRA